MLSLSVIFFSCEKEPSTFDELEEVEKPTAELTIANVKEAFAELGKPGNSELEFRNDSLLKSDSIFGFNFTPHWGLAQETTFGSESEIVIIPITSELFINAPLGSRGNLISYLNENGDLDFTMLLHIPDSRYYAERGYNMSVDDYTGILLPVNEQGCTSSFIEVENGEVINQINLDGLDPSEFNDNEQNGFCLSQANSLTFFKAFLPSERDEPQDEGTEGVDAIYVEPTVIWFIHDIWFGTPGAGGYSPSSNLGGTSGSNGSSGNGSASNTGILLTGFFDESLFDGEELLIAEEINDFKEEHNILIPSAEILSFIENECREEYPHPFIDHIHLQGFLSTPLANCLKDLLADNARKILFSYFNIHLSSSQFEEIFSSDCIYGGNFEQCALTELRDWIGQWVEYTDAQRAWMESYPHIMPGIVNYILNNQEDPELAQVLDAAFDFLEEKGFDDASAQAVKAIFSLIDSDQLAGPYTDAEREAIIQEHFFNPDQYVQFITHCILLRTEWENNHSGQTCGTLCQVGIALEAYWKTMKGVVHTAFDICGLIPVAGEPCDLANGTLYIIEGDGVNATISFAGSIPFLGWGATGVKFASIIIAIPSGVEKTLKITKQGGKYVFSHKSQFRQILGITDPDKQAHHLVAWASREHDVVQKAADAASSPFHMNHPKNGLGIETWRNQPNHNNYNSQVTAALDQIKANLESIHGQILDDIDPNLVSTELKSFQDYLRNLVSSNPNLHLDDLIIDYP